MNGWTSKQALDSPYRCGLTRPTNDNSNLWIDLPMQPSNNPFRNKRDFPIALRLGNSYCTGDSTSGDINGNYKTITICIESGIHTFIHYQAVCTIFAFLNHIREDGLIFWRVQPRMDLPDGPTPQPYSSPTDALPLIPSNATIPQGFSDSDWGSNFTHRRSISGMMLSGAAIVNKTKYQKAVALSGTEAEFVSAAETGKMILYIRPLLTDLGIPQRAPTQLHVNNPGAVFMISSQAPTKRTRHVDIKFFALLDWSQTNQLTVIPIATDHNISDSMTKPTGWIKFHQHADIYMGHLLLM
jgi:hypothetical protein